MKTIVNNYEITQQRKNITKFVESLKEKAIRMINEGRTLQEIKTELYKDVEDNKKNTRIYVSYWPVTDWNKRELLSIRDSSQDCTLVSIIPQTQDK